MKRQILMRSVVRLQFGWISRLIQGWFYRACISRGPFIMMLEQLREHSRKELAQMAKPIRFVVGICLKRRIDCEVTPHGESTVAEL
ncbi:MAG: hypothetical protein R3C11_26855 [Planctomycetaceae bacterium]